MERASRFKGERGCGGNNRSGRLLLPQRTLLGNNKEGMAVVSVEKSSARRESAQISCTSRIRVPPLNLDAGRFVLSSAFCDSGAVHWAANAIDEVSHHIRS